MKLAELQKECTLQQEWVKSRGENPPAHDVAELARLEKMLYARTENFGPVGTVVAGLGFRALTSLESLMDDIGVETERLAIRLQRTATDMQSGAVSMTLLDDLMYTIDTFVRDNRANIDKARRLGGALETIEELEGRK